MSVTYGFYNSENGDRKYTARQISRIFDGIISDGIYQNYGDHFSVNDARVVSGQNGMFVYVGTGRAWLNHTWTLNDSILKLDIEDSDLTNARIDTVIIEIDEYHRHNQIKVIKGTPAANPTAPALTNNIDVCQYALADIRINAGTNSISLSNITNRIGRSNGVPFVTGLFDTMSIDSILLDWQGQFNRWFSNFEDSAEDSLNEEIIEICNNFGNTLSEYVKQISRISDLQGYIGTGTGVFSQHANCKTTVFPVEYGKTYIVKSSGNKCVISFGGSAALVDGDKTYNVIDKNDSINVGNRVENNTNYRYMYVQSHNSNGTGDAAVYELVLTPKKINDEISFQTSERVDIRNCDIRTRTSISSSTGAISPGEIEYTTSIVSFIPVCKGTVIKKGGLKVYILLYSGADYSTFLSFVPSDVNDYVIQNDCFIRLTARDLDEAQAPTVEQITNSIQIIYPNTIKNAIENLSEIITPGSIIENKFIWRDTGEIDTSRYFSATQDILIEKNKDYYFTISHDGTTSTYCAIYAYDANGNHIFNGYDTTVEENNKVYCYIPLSNSNGEQTVSKIFRFSPEIEKIVIVFNKHCTTYISLKTFCSQDYLARQEIEETREKILDLSDKCYITEKSNQTYVDEIISVANSYYNRKDANGHYYMHYDAYNTVLSDDYDGNGGIDCSTFIGLVLRGIPFEDTEYNSEFAPALMPSISNNVLETENNDDPVEENGLSTDAEDALNMPAENEEPTYSYTANPNYDWSINPYDYYLPRYKFGHDDEPKPIRTASQLGQWMRMMGRSVWCDKRLVNLMPGDIVFFARKSELDGFWITETRYMHISHVAIVVNKEPAPQNAAWNTDDYPYKHTLCEVRGIDGACGYSILEDPQNNGVYKNGVDTLVLVCRPDLGRITPTVNT